MALHPAVAQQIEEIRQDRIHGASWLSRQAIGLMNLAVEKSEAENVFIDPRRGLPHQLVCGRGLSGSSGGAGLMRSPTSACLWESLSRLDRKADIPG
jgi:translation initiation factor 2B subunit (eIF-2B alpha/beta/delta family)